MAIIDTLDKISDTVWELPATYKQGMSVPARIIATERLLREMDEAVYQQLSNVAALRGIARYAPCMPDGHSGYGFPIGGVAAMDVHEGGVISPGGIGVDINCGMRLITTNLTLEDVQPLGKFDGSKVGVAGAGDTARESERAPRGDHTRDSTGRE